MTSDAADLTDVVGGFSTTVRGCLARLADEEAGGSGARQVGAQLVDGGWLAAACSEDGTVTQSAPLLLALAEAVGKQTQPLPFPLLESWLALQLLAVCDSDQSELMTAISSGQQIATIIPDTLYDQSDDRALRATAPHAELGSTVLAVRSGAAGRVIVAFDAGSVLWEDRASIDPSMPTAALPKTSGGTDARELGRVDGAELERLASLYLLLQSGELVGAASHLFERTLTFLTVRKQFGVSLDSFQALQHRAADMFTALETSRSLLQLAMAALVAEHDDALEFALTAKGFAATEGWTVANECLQLHGGVGYAWEAGLHQNVRRIAFRSGSGLDAQRCLGRAGSAAVERGTLLRS